MSLTETRLASTELRDNKTDWANPAPNSCRPRVSPAFGPAPLVRRLPLPTPRAVRARWYGHGLARESLLIGAAILLYFGVRGVTEGGEAEAVRHGFDLLRFEGRLGLDLETALQDWTLRNHLLVTVANWIYIWGHWPVITAALIWLHRSDRPQFLQLRNALFASGAIGLVIFTLYPVAPPRLLGAGMVDTVTVWSNSYRVLQPPSLVNKYAALPSLHVGFNLLVGIAVYQVAHNRILKVLGVLSPVAMAIAVVLTANHYLVDAVAGVAVALTGWWLVSAWTGSKQRTSADAIPSLRRQSSGDPAQE